MYSYMLSQYKMMITIIGYEYVLLTEEKKNNIKKIRRPEHEVSICLHGCCV